MKITKYQRQDLFTYKEYITNINLEYEIILLFYDSDDNPLYITLTFRKQPIDVLTFFINGVMYNVDITNEDWITENITIDEATYFMGFDYSNEMFYFSKVV